MEKCIDCNRLFGSTLKPRYQGLCQKCYDHRKWVKSHPNGPILHRGVMGRFIRYIELLPNGCWQWKGSRLPSGYGTFFVDADHRHVYAHRFSYDACNFSPLGSHQAHHTCENKSCVNPYHIQKLTPGEHMRITPGTFAYEQTRRTQCPRGHDYDQQNTHTSTDKYGRVHRSCRSCNREMQRERYNASSLATS